MEGVVIEAEDEHFAAELGHPAGVVGASGDDAPGFSGVLADVGDAFDGFEAAGVIELSRDAEDLAEVGGSDEEEVDIGDGGDVGGVLDGRGGFELNADEGFGVGLLDVFRHRHKAEASVAVSAVQAALAPGVELGPSDGLFGVFGIADHAEHDAADAGLEGAHDGGVVGSGGADEVVEAVEPGGEGGAFELIEGHAGVLLVEPEAIVSAMLADDFDELGVEDLAESEESNGLTAGQAFLDASHRRESPKPEGLRGVFACGGRF